MPLKGGIQQAPSGAVLIGDTHDEDELSNV